MLKSLKELMQTASKESVQGRLTCKRRVVKVIVTLGHRGQLMSSYRCAQTTEEVAQGLNLERARCAWRKKFKHAHGCLMSRDVRVETKR